MKNKKTFKKLSEHFTSSPPLVSRRDKKRVYAERIHGFTCQVIDTEEGRWQFKWTLMRTDGHKDVKTGQAGSLENAMRAVGSAHKKSVIQRPVKEDASDRYVRSQKKTF